MSGNRLCTVVECHETSEKGNINIDAGVKEQVFRNLDVCLVRQGWPYWRGTHRTVPFKERPTWQCSAVATLKFLKTA